MRTVTIDVGGLTTPLSDLASEYGSLHDLYYTYLQYFF